MENKKKGQVTVRNPKMALEIIQELILDDEQLTMEELNRDLKEHGIDPEDIVKRVFELARRVSRDSHSGGSVSPHVSDILTQLADQYYQLDEGNSTNLKEPQSRLRKSVPRTRVSRVDSGSSRASVKSFHRNFKDESPNDRAIRERNEKRLLEKAKKLKLKELARKRKEDL